ncbi:olfactomedin-like [Eublepharis macularius]|uniref:Olfactomedin-like n=1 Tax=Eublepharis macularius TaxID=481883 RepID=A0AA97IUY7_EUBMA|nr:olfactomedin-like [Eublepharis macularius]
MTELPAVFSAMGTGEAASLSGFGKPGTCQHKGIQSIKGPVLVKLNWKGKDFKAGSWGKDFALGTKLQDHYWVFPANKDHRTLETFRLYASYRKMMLYFPIKEFSLKGKNDQCENCGQGAGVIFYNGSFFYNCYDSRALCKMDPNAMQLLHKDLEDNDPASFNNMFSYKGVKYQDMDMAGDEKGLWMIYGSSKANGNMVIQQVDPNNLKVGRLWTTTQPKTEVTNSFMICGVLYATQRVNATHEEIFYYYDTNTAQEGNIHIFMEKALPTVQSLNYNPNDENLYMFNDAYLVYYNVTFKDHISVISRGGQVEATGKGQRSDSAGGHNVIKRQVQADASKQDQISDLASKGRSNASHKERYAVVHRDTMQDR